MDTYKLDYKGADINIYLGKASTALQPNSSLNWNNISNRPDKIDSFDFTKQYLVDADLTNYWKKTDTIDTVKYEDIKQTPNLNNLPYVKYGDIMQLTDEQKQRARNNIGASTGDYLQYSTIAPIADNPNGLKVVVLSDSQSTITKRNGYLYLFVKDN